MPGGQHLATWIIVRTNLHQSVYVGNESKVVERKSWQGALSTANASDSDSGRSTLNKATFEVQEGGRCTFRPRPLDRMTRFEKKTSCNKCREVMTDCTLETVLSCAVPKLDVEVGRGTNHWVYRTHPTTFPQSPDSYGLRLQDDARNHIVMDHLPSAKERLRARTPHRKVVSICNRKI